MKESLLVFIHLVDFFSLFPLFLHYKRRSSQFIDMIEGRNGTVLTNGYAST